MQKSLLKLLVICLLGSVDYSCCIAGLGQQKSGRLRHKAVTTVGSSWRREMSSAFAAECVWGKPHSHTRCLQSSAFFCSNTAASPPSLILSSRWILIFLCFYNPLTVSASFCFSRHKHLKTLLPLKNSFKNRKIPYALSSVYLLWITIIPSCLSSSSSFNFSVSLIPPLL